MALVSNLTIFPRIVRLNAGDPYPADGMFGSGSEILWGFGTTGPADGDFFAPLVLGTFESGPQYAGWVHLKISNATTSSPTITIVDWAYSDQLGQKLFMGQRAQSITLSSSATPAVLGQSVTFTAAVTSPGGTPTGTVTFKDGAATLGAVPLNSGQALFTTSSLAVGAHPITAQYNGSVAVPADADSLTQQVTYGICPLYNQGTSLNSGVPFPITVALCNYSGAYVFSPATVLHATAVTLGSTVIGAPQSPGNVNANGNFLHFGTTYFFLLSTNGLAGGAYGLQFTATGDPITHSVGFGVR